MDVSIISDDIQMSLDSFYGVKIRLDLDTELYLTGEHVLGSNCFIYNGFDGKEISITLAENIIQSIHHQLRDLITSNRVKVYELDHNDQKQYLSPLYSNPNALREAVGLPAIPCGCPDDAHEVWSEKSRIDGGTDILWHCLICGEMWTTKRDNQ